MRSVPNVSAAAATLLLSNSTFSGALPTRTQGGTRPSAGQTPPTGGPDGAGGSSFSVDSFTVLGLNPADAAVGPLSAVTLTAGRSLASTDAGAHVAVLDASYATTASLAVGGTVAIAGTDFSIVGLVSAATADSATAANVYIPLDVAQTLAALPGQVSNIYVQAASSTNITQVQADIRTALPAATVKTQADLASSVSGSLASASSLVSNLGLWLSLIVLAAAFLIAILFTISGVTRRTREFGTLKAIGWSNGRIVRQVGGESLVQGLIGGVVGIVVGLAGILVINIIAPTLTAGASTAVQAAGRGSAGGRRRGRCRRRGLRPRRRRIRRRNPGGRRVEHRPDGARHGIRDPRRGRARRSRRPARGSDRGLAGLPAPARGGPAQHRMTRPAAPRPASPRPASPPIFTVPASRRTRPCTS
ncbi:ABC transporter permease [Cryobacterium breve]|uniref:ABC transporter permease n=1 Tax=Cryobacterium breve TaxID=1259258 RepID=UPI00248C7323|nr:ABC transporter permease [Cryobacterium breve]